MADEYQVDWEYSAGNSIAFKTNDLQVEYIHPGYHEDVRVDGTIVVTDPGNSYRQFTWTATLTGNDMDTLDAVLVGTITHTGLYPRLKKIYWDGNSFEENVEVGRLFVRTLDRGAGHWHIQCRVGQKDQ
jgi:hypothetical protein